MGAAGTASAATNVQLAKLLEQLNQRVQKLEQANADLQHELVATRAKAVAAKAATPAASAVEQRLTALEQQQSLLATSLDSDTISEKEPDLSARLKAVEVKTQELSGPVGKLAALNDIKGGLSLSMVAQKSLASCRRRPARLPPPMPLCRYLKWRHRAILVQPVAPRAGLWLGSLPSGFSNPLATAFQLGLGAKTPSPCWPKPGTRPVFRCPWEALNLRLSRTWKLPSARWIRLCSLTKTQWLAMKPASSSTQHSCTTPLLDGCSNHKRTQLPKSVHQKENPNQPERRHVRSIENCASDEH